MERFIVTITETLQREVSVEASSKDEAIAKAKRLYATEHIVLDWSDFQGVDYSCK